MKVLVTGSSRGLGREIIKVFAHHNYDVIINYNKSQKEALELKKELDNLVNVSIIKADIQNEEEVKKMFASFDTLDILINNAAIAIDKDPLEKSAAEFNKVLTTNLTGTFLSTKYAVAKMKSGGSIINISSTNALDTYYPESIDYDASKIGIISLTHNFAKYLTDIRVNCICPDWIDTDMNREMDKDYRKKINFIKPEDLALLVYNVAINKNINDKIIKVGGKNGE
jgi:3-oxoacyl-[acyl-carrier protein] reductase